MVNYKKQGKRNKRRGADFERRTRKDLESKGFICSKWQNNVELIPNFKGKKWNGKCVPAKPGRFRMMQTGFSDFIAYKEIIPFVEDTKGTRYNVEKSSKCWDIIFIECKTNGYLSKKEKEKARWYLENNYCSKFFIAYKEKDPNDKRKILVKYKDFEKYDNKK